MRIGVQFGRLKTESEMRRRRGARPRLLVVRHPWYSRHLTFWSCGNHYNTTGHRGTFFSPKPRPVTVATTALTKFI
jgi:hypothetical protein